MFADTCSELHGILSQSVVPFWVSITTSVASLCDKYVDIVQSFRVIADYLEINIAGFRKILKQLNKQIPMYVHVCLSVSPLLGTMTGANRFDMVNSHIDFFRFIIGLNGCERVCKECRIYFQRQAFLFRLHILARRR